MEALSELATGAFVMAIVTSFYALARLAVRSSATPEFIKADAVCYSCAIVLTLAFAGATFLLGNGLAAFINAYVAIILALTVQGCLVALAMRVTDTMASSVSTNNAQMARS